MLARARYCLLSLAMLAMLLGALLPQGWMPGNDLSAPLTLCTMGGPVQQAPADPAKHKPADDGQNHGCPFAAAPHLATPTADAFLILPGLSLAWQNLIPARRRAEPALIRSAHGPRAPPAFA